MIYYLVDNNILKYCKEIFTSRENFKGHIYGDYL